MTMSTLLSVIEIAFLVITILGVIYDYSRSTFSSGAPVPDI